MLAVLIGAVVGIAAPARAQVPCPYAPQVQSYSRACAPTANCLDSGSQAGHPAVSSVSKGDGFEGFNFSADSALSFDNGWFASNLHTGGSETIYQFSSNGASSNVIGDAFDCLTVSGGVGTARLHIPVAIQGDAFVSWSVGGVYVPPPNIDMARSTLHMHCSGYHYGTSSYGACSEQYDAIYNVSQTIDTTFEMVFQVNFDDPLTIQYGPRISGGVGYAANGSDGALQGTADIFLEGQLLPAYLTDFGGNVLPTPTIVATSGFDYLHPVPEPDTAAAAAAAFLALAALRRRRTRRALLGMILIGVASPTNAQTCDPASATSLSQVCGPAPFCFDSGAQAPHAPPVSSTVAHTFSEQTISFFETTGMGVVNIGSFGATTHVSGNTIIDAAARGAGAGVTGVFTDCATASGYSGAGILHIPIHLTGSRMLTYTPAGYVPPPPPSPPPSRAQLRILCAAGTAGSGVPTPCADPTIDWTESGDVDTTVELVFGFSFEQPVVFQFSPQLSASVGDPGTGVPGGPGILSGDADVTLAGTLLPAYITDAGGTVLAGATLQANSGFDYLTAPEPFGAWTAAAIALLLLRRARVRASR
jgi:hypothetical protein